MSSTIEAIVMSAAAAALALGSTAAIGAIVQGKAQGFADLLTASIVSPAITQIEAPALETKWWTPADGNRFACDQRCPENQ